MKQLLLATVLATLTTQAFAQTKLWTWKAKQGPYTQVLRTAAMASDGSAAFVIGQPRPPEGFTDRAPRYLIVWVSAKGKELLSTEIQTTDSDWKIAGDVSTWEVALFDKDKLVVGNDENVRIYKLENGKVSPPKILKTANPMMFGGNGFQGWLSTDGVPNRLSVYDDGGDEHWIEVKHVVSLTAWKP
ncbi:MAG: hypothetical protein ABIS50_11465 [Luteolibacter sp.]|uniref:hypothetical protein n=1 Tax=Luteolibacter sp. TaxID=1962973 RepID=UPI00326494A4